MHRQFKALPPEQDLLVRWTAAALQAGRTPPPGLREGTAGRGLPQALTAELAALDPAIWQKLYALALRNRLALLLWDSLQNSPVREALPKEVRLPWLLHVAQGRQHRAKVQALIARWQGLLQAQGLGMMVYKGPVLAGYYPKPELREFADIDFCVFALAEGRPLSEEASQEAYLRALDCIRQSACPLVHQAPHETSFRCEGVRMELHGQFLGTHRYRIDQSLEPLLRARLRAQGPLPPTPDLPFYRPPLDFHLLFCLRHLLIHLPVESHLRYFTDWTLMLNAAAGGVDLPWLSEVWDSHGLGPVTRQINRLCVQYLGLKPGVAAALEAGLQATDLSRAGGQGRDKEGLRTQDLLSYVLDPKLRPSPGPLPAAWDAALRKWTAHRRLPALYPLAHNEGWGEFLYRKIKNVLKKH